MRALLLLSINSIGVKSMPQDLLPRLPSIGPPGWAEATEREWRLAGPNRGGELGPAGARAGPLGWPKAEAG